MIPLRSLCVSLFIAAAGCYDSEQCVADCVDSEEGPVDSSTCVEANDAAQAFFEQNRSCETMLDCVQVDSHCYEGEGSSLPCGVVLSKDADLAQWNVLHDDIERGCGCVGSSSCSDGVICSLDNQCTAGVEPEERCASVERDINVFLGANKACESDEDCMSLPGVCFTESCTEVGFNVDTNPEDWARLDQALLECEYGEDGAPTAAYCNVEGDCGAMVRCSDEGLCVAER